MQARSSRLAALTIAIFVAAMAVISTVPSASASAGAGVRAADAPTCQRPPPITSRTFKVCPFGITMSPGRCPALHAPR